MILDSRTPAVHPSPALSSDYAASPVDSEAPPRSTKKPFSKWDRRRQRRLLRRQSRQGRYSKPRLKLSRLNYSILSARTSRRKHVLRDRVRLVSENVIRAIATHAARNVKTWEHHRIRNLPQAIGTVCRVAMRCGRKFAVQEYVRAELLEFQRQVAKGPRIGFGRKTLVEKAREVLQAIELTILDVAEHGRHIKRELPDGYRAVHACLPLKGRGACVLLVKPMDDGSLIVHSLMTVQEYDRSCSRGSIRSQKDKRMHRRSHRHGARV